MGAFRFVPSIDEALRDQLPVDVLAMLADRDRQLEDYLSGVAGTKQTFSHAGTPTTDESGRWYPETGGKALRVLASANTAGSSSTVFTIYVSGVSVGTVTLASSDNVEVATFAVNIAGSSDGTGDYVTVAATTVGTGVENVTVQVTVL